MHRILTQTLDFSTATEAAALDVQRVLSRVFAGAERGRLEEVFDRLAGEGTLRIDRLELYLGMISGSDWLDQLFERLADAAERAISAEDPAPAPGRAALLPSDGGTAAQAVGVTRPDAPVTMLEAVAAYLVTGRLPWWSDLMPYRGWLDAAIDRLGPPARDAIAALAAGQPRALHRIILALAPEAVAVLLAPRIPDLEVGRLMRLAGILADAPAARGTAVSLALEFWTACLGAGAGAGEGTGTRAATLRRGLAAFVAASIRRGALTKPASRAFAATLPSDWLAPFWADCAAAGWPVEEIPPTPVSKMSVPGPRPGPAAKVGLRHPAPLPDTRPPDPAVVSRRGPQADAPARPPPIDTRKVVIPVADAGLVLFHPFLPELFTRCGFWVGKAFTGPSEQHAAARLLGNIAHSDAEADEAVLTLAKVLTGIEPPEAVLDPEPPDPEAIAKADALIGAVLDHWSALKSQDHDFLREVFVRRAGHLSRTDDGWSLRVESLAQDVLLDRLPWGIGVVRLPWMTQFMTVRWRD
jgi:hypothetical protein